MSDGNLWERDEIASPCVKICVVHPESRICLGCNRTIDEIAGRSRMTPEERTRIMADLPTRGAELNKRRGGRAARLARQAGKG
jgi:uncharacterized protein